MRIFAAALLVVTASAAHPQSIDLTGHWKGTVDIPNRPLEYEVDLGTNATGNLIGTVTTGPDRSVFPLLEIVGNGRHVAFFARTDQPFEGEVSEDGKLISGSATLSGYALPFSMARTGAARIDPPPASRAVSKDLEGTWKGTPAISASFTGELNAGATDIVGTWTQRGMNLPLTITRSDPEGAR